MNKSKLKIWLRRVRKRCVVCGDADAPWVWPYEGGEARLCDWDNAAMQMETRLHPLRREPVS